MVFLMPVSLKIILVLSPDSKKTKLTEVRV